MLVVSERLQIYKNAALDYQLKKGMRTWGESESTPGVQGNSVNPTG
jgi:hypothetical protein